MNKITHRFHLTIMACLVFMVMAGRITAQDTVLNKYGLWVISDMGQFQKTIQNNPAMAMQDLEKSVPGLVFDLRYATKNNFMQQQLYPKIKTTYLRKPAADALLKIQQDLFNLGLGLKIFDAYRPYSVTERLWEPVQDDRYAADPKKGSGHNRGIAVDLTVINLQTGEELPMGTGFDNFTDTAHHTFTNLPVDVLQNRTLLKTLMEKHGFKALESEWWHYYLPDIKTYELLDLDFKQLKKLHKQHAERNTY